ncbi:hypothetical protein Tco_0500078 [Tanacetum coccineum]
MKKKKRSSTEPELNRKMKNMIYKERRTPVTQDASTGPSAQPLDDTSANVVQDTSSPADSTNVAKTYTNVELTDSDTQTEILNIAEERVYPRVHESLKHTTEEHVLIDNPLSSFGTLSSMKNLDDACTFGDQFLNDKSMEDAPRKANMEAEVVSMVIVPIHQASSSVPPLSTPVIDLSPPKSMLPHVVTATTATTPTTLPPPPQMQSTTDPELANRVSTLEKRSAALSRNSNSRIRQLKLLDQGDLSKIQMKEILHDRMFESDSYRSHPEHVRLYEALEASMDHPPLPPPKDSNRSKKKKQDSDASASTRPPVQKLSAWMTSNIREAPSSSSKQQPASQSKQPVNDDPIPEDVHLYESEDTGAAHLPKIKTRPDWLRPILEEERPKTPKPEWVIPPNDLPETENNWADALAKTYKDPKEHKLLRKTRDMASFIK